ncbi:unnamed protein product [Adineta ricciae]|uniref:4-alpha-glucanotransferase n=1 Tax=Adineta ricciae TaxID=249248 RepID=A0A816BZB3_ADIRI|nr:unnamed protein product [Adineta ricciae]
MKLERSAGILLHITSLPSKYGIGDFGSDAFRFVDFLAETKQKLWQILPLTTINCPSPYSSESSCGGNPWLISPEKLTDMNVLSSEDLELLTNGTKFHGDYVSFKDVNEFKEKLLKKSFENFQNSKNHKEILDKFYADQSFWIDDFVLFMIIKSQHKGLPWNEWPSALRHHDPAALDELRRTNRNEYEYHLFVQYIFDQQWKQLKKYANEKNIQIIGDMAMYVDYNSVDVWANSKLFKLDSNTMRPTVVSGFPADENYDIQIWNQPVYQWNDANIRQDLFQWWIRRIEKSLSICSNIQAEHIRCALGKHTVRTVKNQIFKRKNSSGYELFSAVKSSLGEDISLVVEDIGSVTSEVFQLRDAMKFYGIRILQMGFYCYPDNIYSPHNYLPNSIAYTGTHDNATSLEWWTSVARREEKDLFKKYVHRPCSSEVDFEKHIPWYFIQMILQSASNGAIVLMQDLLSVNVRMNYPGKDSSMEENGPQNWSWRFKWSQLTSNIREELKELTEMYGRNLLYGKAIPPKDMIMQGDSSFFLK